MNNKYVKVLEIFEKNLRNKNYSDNTIILQFKNEDYVNWLKNVKSNLPQAMASSRTQTLIRITADSF